MKNKHYYRNLWKDFWETNQWFFTLLFILSLVGIVLVVEYWL